MDGERKREKEKERGKGMERESKRGKIYRKELRGGWGREGYEER